MHFASVSMQTAGSRLEILLIGSAGDGVIDFISDLKLSQFVDLTSIGLIGVRFGRPELIRMVNGRWSDLTLSETWKSVT